MGITIINKPSVANLTQKKLEGYLREKGFNCEKIIPNIKYQNLSVFVHKYSDELAQLITDYIESVKGES